MAVSLIGQPGTRAPSRAVEEARVERERAQTQHHNMAAPTVPVTCQILRTVTHKLVQVKFYRMYIYDIDLWYAKCHQHEV
jgi:hypothetical protein